ncbi:MAG TPA: carboxypeptidase-like regulatory domain-containing protein [Terracidiphilus sp.]|jgi:hypothetical protein|nr:carboxypeptidase-like regulatory domain-containing protein [Terracidiphilus sp.]
MLFRRIHRIAALGLVLGLGLTTFNLSAQDSDRRGRKYKTPAPTSRIEVTILRADDGKPIENAAVIFTMVGDKGNMELKTNEDGKAMIDVLPTGCKVVLQVLAKGYQTYGKDYEIDKAQMALEVKLKRPSKQYSIYDKHPEAAQGNGEGKDKPADKDSTDSPKGDPPAESANESGSKPDANQPQPQ